MGRNGKGGTKKPKDPTKAIYGNAQELTAMVFGYDLSTDDGKAAVDNLLSSYQQQSGGGYVVDKNGVVVKKDPTTTFDSDRFFSDMDTMLGFGEGDFEGISTANLDIKKNQTLINEQIQKNVFHDQNGGITGFNLKYDEQGNLHRAKGVHDATNYQDKAYKQHEAAINQAAIDYEKNTRQAIKDANEARKPRNKASIEDIRKTPDLLLGIPEDKQRELVDRAMYGQGRKKEVPKIITHNMKNKTALDSFSAKTLADNDFLFKIDASDDVLNAVYQNVHDKKWQTDYIRRKYNDGGFSQYEFKAKKYDDLSKAQKQMLMDDYHNTELKALKDNFDYVDFDESALGDPNKKSLNRGYSASRARQNYMQRTFFNGVDPNSGDFDKAFTNAINNATTDSQVKALEAYRDYAKDTFNQAKTTRLQGAEEYMMERLTKKEAKQASKLLGREMGDTGKALMKGLGNDGIGAASKLKGLKVAGGIAAGAVALWAAGEIWDE